MIFYLFIALGLVGAAIHLYFDKKPRSRNRILEILLTYLLATTVGLMGLWAFMGHLFFSAQVAHLIGWPAGSPFQKEIAFANLGYGVLGILCIWLRGNFWLATIIGQGVFMWGTAGVHLWQIMAYQNYAIDNAGTILYLDILIPLILAVLWIDWKLTQRKEANQQDNTVDLNTQGPDLGGQSLP